ncbi:MAG TPA: hypothetical protein DEA08_24070 [Planctomycetes bacterium]|nr:hypothetical protein [Planctomycetota bacterium]
MSNPVPRLRRLLSIIPMIQRRGEVSLSELQRVLGVSKRELQGDLNAIMLCGVPPYLPNDYISVFIEDDRVTIDYADHFSRPARLTLQEALALRLAIARLRVPEDGPLYEATQELLGALDRLMLGNDFASLIGKIEGAEPTTNADLSMIDRALRERRRLRFTYYSPSSERVTARTVRPYGRGDRQGNEYLFAFCEKREADLTFRVDRISDLELEGEGNAYLIPKDFDLEKRLAKVSKVSGGPHLRIRFAEALAAYEAEETEDRDLEWLPNGDVVISNSCNSIEYAVNDVLHRGELAEVLEPPEARKQLASRLEAFLAQDE